MNAPAIGGPLRGETDPYRPFAPRRGAVVAGITAAVILALTVILVVTLPAGGRFGWSVLDRTLLFAFGGAGAAFVFRYTRLRAVPSPAGLRVVNLIRRHDLEWAEVMGVGFADGAPWPVLELTDTEEVAVMAIQRADGARASSEAARLAALIRHHSGREPGPQDAGAHQ